MQNKKYISFLAISLIASFIVAIPVFAQINAGIIQGTNNPDQTQKPSVTGISGTVASINGTTLTVTNKPRLNGIPATTYIVNALGAKVIKNGATSSLSNIAVGDTVVVQGTVSDNNIIAKTIRDGLSQLESVIQGNGQPIVAGSVTAMNGSAITMTNKSNIVYTVDASSAKIIVGAKTSSISDIAVGDDIIVQGAINGTSVNASSIIDQKVAVKSNTINPSNNQNQSKKPKPGFIGGMMDGVVNFFKHLFGF